MTPFETLAARAGSWRGTNTLQDPHAAIADASPSALTIAGLPDGSVRLDYTWAYRGEPQRGSLLLQQEGSTVSTRWTDTWHTSDRPMGCSGPAGPALSVRGSYAAPPGPDWGWRIDLDAGGDQVRVVMFNVWPAEQGGQEELAVQAEYTRE